MKSSKPSVVVLGSGNVASSLAPAIERSGAGNVVQVYSRDIGNAQTLAAKLSECCPVDDPADIVTDADIYLVTLADDAVGPVLSRIIRNDALWLHTSGSLPMTVLAENSSRYGVFYPLQTFSKSRPVDLDTVSLFTEGSSEATEHEIRQFGAKIFKNIYHADSMTRRKMHVAAVFACNFTNYMWTIAWNLLKSNDIPFDVLEPLLRETLEKALKMPPRDGQTGPARRRDTGIIEAHASSLPESEAKLYRLLSDCIIKEFYGTEK